MQRTVTFAEHHGWHEAELHHALMQHGAANTTCSLRDCRLGSGHPAGIALPGFDDALPDAVLVRSVPAGSFEEVTFRLGILHALHAAGVYVCNPASIIERTIDKAMTSFLLLQHQIRTPDVWVCESKQCARAVIQAQLDNGIRLVQKPLFGNCGRGLKLIDMADCELDTDMINGVYYLQHYIDQPDHAGRDWRVFVIGHRAVAAMERVSAGWITNRARGGDCLSAVLTPELRQLAEQASRATGLHYGGVDIIRDMRGNYLVLEVNSVPAWRGLQSVQEISIAERLARTVLENLPSETPPSGAGSRRQQPADIS